MSITKRSSRILDLPAIGEMLPGPNSEFWKLFDGTCRYTWISACPDCTCDPGHAQRRGSARQLQSQGAVPVGSTPAEFARMLPIAITGRAKAAKAVKSANVPLD